FAGFKETPNDFDLEHPVRRMREINQRNKLRSIDLESFLRTYRDEFDLKAPYFSYRCDGHLNPLGHFLATNLIAKYLIVNDLVPLDSVRKIRVLSRLERNMKLSPVDILSEEGYEQIYKTGRFKGKTNIIKILQTLDQSNPTQPTFRSTHLKQPSVPEFSPSCGCTPS